MKSIIILVITMLAATGGVRMGGYVPVNVSDPGVQRAAGVAFEKVNEIINANFHSYSVLSAEQQLVAGLNYRIRMEFKNAAGFGEFHTVVVFKSLHDKYSLTKYDDFSIPN